MATGQLSAYTTPRYGDIYFTSYNAALVQITKEIEAFARQRYLHSGVEFNEELLTNDGLCGLTTLALMGQYGIKEHGSLLDIGWDNDFITFAYAEVLAKAGFIIDEEKGTATPPAQPLPPGA